MRYLKNQGFTLMELLVVIALLGILVTAGLSSFKSSQQRSRDTRRKSDLRAIRTAFETYYNDKGQYPNASVDGKIMGCGVNDQQECPWGGQFSDKNNTIYMVTLPGDPTGAQKYFYYVGTQNKSFQIYARLENLQDNTLELDANNKPMIFSGTNCASSGTLGCNYGIASLDIRTIDYGHSYVSE